MQFSESLLPLVRVNVGSKNYLVTSSTVRAGEEVTDIYSMHYSEIAGEKRRCWQCIYHIPTYLNIYLSRSWLQRSFHFTCQCPACQQDWDTFDNLGEEVLSLFIARKNIY